MAGAHLGRKGYFEYERDGFGPVVTERSAAVAACAAIEHGPARALYQARIDRTFVDRDGRLCAVVAAIESLERPTARATTRPAIQGGDSRFVHGEGLARPARLELTTFRSAT